jgi:hypothetical protein
MIKSIKKRDGRVVLYNEDKIAQAILKAMQALILKINLINKKIGIIKK